MLQVRRGGSQGPVMGVRGTAGREGREKVCDRGWWEERSDSTSPACPAGDRTGNSLMVSNRHLM